VVDQQKINRDDVRQLPSPGWNKIGADFQAWTLQCYSCQFPGVPKSNQGLFVGTFINGYRAGMPGGLWHKYHAYCEDGVHHTDSVFRSFRNILELTTRSMCKCKTKGSQSRRRVGWIVWNADESMEHKTPRRGQNYGLAICSLRGNIRFLVYACISPNSQSRSTTPISRARQAARKSPKPGSLQSGVT
jgi:hypothetical protein